jgi:chemotaxis protein methyltransferase CheR
MEIHGKPVIPPEEFRLIREFVAETFGLLLDECKSHYLAAKLLPRLKELRLASFYDYYSYLKFAPGAAEEHLKLIPLITNNETYFFRELPQLQVFAEEIIPALKERKNREGSRTIRIVSAGCSTGEEVYTLAILLLESGQFIWDWDLEIIGIDVDPIALERAKTAVYTGRAFQSMPAQHQTRYFRKTAEGLQVRDNVQNITRFIQGNMLDFASIMGDTDIDIIFCRNALIYFNDQTVKRIAESFAKTLVRDGLLFLGHSESLLRITSRFEPLCYPGTIIYRLKHG